MAKDRNTDNKRKDHSRRRRSHPLSPVARKEQRRNDAEARQAEHDSLTIEQRIEKARTRRGKSERELESLTETLAILNDKEAMDAIAEAQAEKKPRKKS